MPYPLADALERRATAFSVRLLKFVRTFPRDATRDTVFNQALRSGTSVAANYRSARRARSRAEFISQLGVVVQEADETEHWLEVIRDAGLARGAEFQWLAREATELRAIFTAARNTARANHRANS